MQYDLPSFLPDSIQSRYQNSSIHSNMNYLLCKIIVVFAISTVISGFTLIYPNELRLKRLNYCLKDNKISYSDR